MAEISNFPLPAPVVARKKFATPPVKIACLACRSSRTRCNGDHPCASCASKDRECVYKPSRRGGPRTRKKPKPPEPNGLPPNALEPVAAAPHPLMVESYINPGAGLKNLHEVIPDSDLLFDTLFNNPAGMVIDTSAVTPEAGPAARSYASDAAVLNSYYIWIHPYFPILPPPEHPLLPDQAVPLFQKSKPVDIDESSSPVALALSAILALIPCAQDSNPLSEESILFRRKYAQFLAQAAFECIEAESEKPESSIEPSRALEDSDDEFLRPAFHPGVPLQLESIIALDLLSVYEYAQRGNLKRMRTRAHAALMSAMFLNLHTRTDEEDEYSEARRRVWWMTYICICQSSIVSNTHPAFDIFSPNFTAKFPQIKSDAEAWPVFLSSQQAILTATRFVIDLNEAIRTKSDMNPIYQRMVDLEASLEPLLTTSETWVLDCPLTQTVDYNERVVSQALKCLARIKLNSARIKVHRYCAFFDLPVFPRKNCDLKAVQEQANPGEGDLRHWPSCCSNLLGGHTGSSTASHSGASSASPTLSKSSTPTCTSPSGHGHSHSAPASRTSTTSTTTSSTQATSGLLFPYSGHQSARICLQSALNIAQAFDLLPYPNPSAQPCEPPSYLGPFSGVIAPRTMPSFACCAMQCAYVCLMVYDRTQSVYASASGLGVGMGGGGGVGDAASSSVAGNLMGRLQQGLLSILATLENYGTAFEALGGMRDQIRDKVYSSINFNS